MTSDLLPDRDHRRTRAGKRPNRRGFSLIEMMIAIVILGLGLIMVATMFPVAWGRARRLQEFTSQVSCTSIAETTVNLQMHVDDGADPIGVAPNDSPTDRISFAGDQIRLSMKQNAFPLDAFLDADSRVHPLHMQNIRVNTNEAAFVFENPYMLDPNDPLRLLINPENDLPLGWKTYLEPQIRLIDRVYPPLPPRENVLDSGVFDEEDSRWQAALDTRRFCWAVFHKLDEEYVAIVNDPPGNLIDKKRQFKMYYVTLRRTGATHRFARQDTEVAFLPDPNQRSEPANVRAMDEDEDLLFPVAWRVQILLPGDSIVFPDATTDPTTDATGVRTEVMAGMTDDAESSTATNELVATMFRRGTHFIDEVNGRVYRVQRVRTNGDGDLAFLTLDSEILGGDVDDGEFAGNGRLESDEFLRTVWVFPPRVIGRDSSNNEQPLFAGRPPVVAIETRSLTKRP